MRSGRIKSSCLALTAPSLRCPGRRPGARVMRYRESATGQAVQIEGFRTAAVPEGLWPHEG